MNFALERLAENGWIHIFSEAKCNPDMTTLLPFKWGVARLIRESKVFIMFYL
jgi:hypothetical protein